MDVVTRGTPDAVNPCSNAKLVTAAYALSVLGPAHRFQTDVLQAPDGALALRGAFDPTLTFDDLVALARALHARGVREVPRVVIDASALAGTDVPADFAQYGDQDWEYLARPSAFAVNKNMVHASILPGAHEGAPARVQLDQGTFAVRSRVTTSPAGSEFKVGIDERDGADGPHEAGSAHDLARDGAGKAIIDVWGSVALGYAGPNGKGKELAMKSPAPLESARDQVARAFAAAGIRVGAVVSGPAPAGAEKIHAHRSAPLARILEESVARSSAFDHEMLALACAHKQSGGAPVTIAGALAKLNTFLHDELGAEGALANASGIGNASRLRARDVVALLERCGRDARLAPLLDGLARPGGDGTLKTRMLDTPAEGAFAGKTGTGRKAVALSGTAGDVAMSLLAIRIPSREGARAALDAMAIALSTWADGARSSGARAGESAS